MRKQLRNSICMALDSGFMQGRHAMLICSIDIGSTVLQELHELHVPLQGCQMERCSAPLDTQQASSLHALYAQVVTVAVSHLHVRTY